MALGPAAIYGYMSLPERPDSLAGGAFLIGIDVVVTCAHVVRDHLGLGKVTPEQAPTQRVKIRFPALDSERDGEVIPGGWFTDPEQGGARPLRDVAVIRLTTPIEDSDLIFPPIAATSPPPEGKGYIIGAGPGWQEHEQEIEVKLSRTINARGRWQVTDLRGYGAAVVPGFSG